MCFEVSPGGIEGPFDRLVSNAVGGSPRYQNTQSGGYHVPGRGSPVFGSLLQCFQSALFPVDRACHTHKASTIPQGGFGDCLRDGSS